MKRGLYRSHSICIGETAPDASGIVSLAMTKLEEPPVLFPDGDGSVAAADIRRNREILAAVSARIDQESGGRQREEEAGDTLEESKQREQDTEVREEGESSCPNVAAVARFIEARERRDADAAREMLHDDVCLIKPDFKMKGFAPPKPQLLPGPKRFGRDVVLSYFDEEEFGGGRTVCEETGRTLNAVVYHRRGSEGVKGESREVQGAVEYVRFSKKDARKSVGVAWHKISLLMKQIFTVKDGRILKIEVVVLNPDLISWSGKFHEFEDECFANMMKEALAF